MPYIKRILTLIGLFLLCLSAWVPIAHSQTDNALALALNGNSRVQIDRNISSRTKNDAVFDKNFADFDSLSPNTLIHEQIVTFLAFTTNLEINVDAVRGNLENKLELIGISGRKDGVKVLQIDRISVEWNISEIALGRLVINRLLLDQVTIEGGWAKQATVDLELESPNIQQKPAFRIFGFELPQLPISLFVNNVLVRNLALSESITRQKMALDMAGRINIPSGQAPIDTDFEIVRRDQVRGRVQAKLIWQPETTNLTLELLAEETATVFYKRL